MRGKISSRCSGGIPSPSSLTTTLPSGPTAISTVVASNASVASEKTKGKFTEQYRELVSSYEALAHETRDLQTATQTELAELRQKVESIEHMMREVA